MSYPEYPNSNEANPATPYPSNGQGTYGVPAEGTPYGTGGYAQMPQMPLYPGPAPYFDPYAKSRLIAGLLGIMLGALGVHRFYLGYKAIGIIQIVVTIVTFGVGVIWPLVEGLMIIANSSSFQTDADGRPLRP